MLLEIQKKRVERQKLFFDAEIFRRNLKDQIERVEGEDQGSLEVCMNLLNKTYKESCVVRNGIQNMQYAPYWWSLEIESKRKECIAARRRLTRQTPGTNVNNPNVQTIKEQYQLKRKQLKNLIRKSKNQHWKDLCTELNDNLWGNGYKIAVKHLTSQTMPYSLSKQIMEKIMDKLFPTKEDQWLRGNIVYNVEEFTVEELTLAGKRMKSGKAPGPDRIPSEPVKEMIKTAPDFLLATLNHLLRELSR